MNFFNKIKKIFNKNELEVYDKGLKKSNIKNKLIDLFDKHKSINDSYFEDLEELFINSDLGIKTTMDFIDRLKKRVNREKHIEDITELIIDELFLIYVSGDMLTSKISFSNKPTVLLFVGVNGVGKTTTIAKVANKLKDEGKKVLLVAADTFRFGAKEQLIEWGKNIDVEVVSNNSTDPSSVIYDGLNKSVNEDYDVVLIDTAGRLENKVNLMNELDKMNKVIKNFVNYDFETLLVLDATTGQNAINQVEKFKEITNITGIVLTKLDGTAKGGILFSIKELTDIPVKFIGLGEKITDLEYFDIEKYIYGLFR